MMKLNPMDLTPVSSRLYESCIFDFHSSHRRYLYSQGEMPMFRKGQIVLYHCTSFFVDKDGEVVSCAGGKIGKVLKDVRRNQRVASVKTKLQEDCIPGKMNDEFFSGPELIVEQSTMCDPSRHLLFETGPGKCLIFGIPQPVAYPGSKFSGSLQWGTRVKIFSEVGNVVDRIADIFATDYIGWTPANPKGNKVKQSGIWPLLPNRDNQNMKLFKSALFCGICALRRKAFPHNAEWHVSYILFRCNC